MKRVYVNEENCLGCHLCEVECVYANSNVDKSVGRINAMKKAHDGSTLPRIRIEEGDVNFAVACRHCDKPYCVMGCITGALHVEDGTVVVDKDKCVGCRTCILMCPYGCLVIDNDKTMTKCELCISTGEPACVKACPNRAIVYEVRD